VTPAAISLDGTKISLWQEGKETSVMSQLEGLPTRVTGFEATGKIAAEDYRDVVLPALKQAAQSGDVRFLIVMREFDGISGGAIWQDLKVGIEHLHAWKRIALVTDVNRMGHLTDLFGWMTPGETKTFALDQREQAIQWVTRSEMTPATVGGTWEPVSAGSTLGSSACPRTTDMGQRATPFRCSSVNSTSATATLAPASGTRENRTR
jgi:hypothetical protein